MSNSPTFVTPLSDLCVIQAEGADAASFLHGQLTQDITGLTPGVARLAGYCTPKGRLLATLLIWRDPAHTDNLLALVKADIAQMLVKRLSMFVLRSKAKLSLTPLTVLGISTTDLAANTRGAAPGMLIEPLPDSSPPWSVQQTALGTWISTPDQPTGQRWWLVPTPDSDLPQAEQSNLQAAWQSADIAAGLPWIDAATQDMFIPQTLNLDLIEGVNFTKGCYPGQEIVARSHYRGTIKRRMAYGTAQVSELNGPILSGSDIFDAGRPASPAGRVINAALCADAAHLLLEVQLRDLDTAHYRLGTPDGAAITIQSLPYRITATETA